MKRTGYTTANRNPCLVIVPLNLNYIVRRSLIIVDILLAVRGMVFFIILACTHTRPLLVFHCGGEEEHYRNWANILQNACLNQSNKPMNNKLIVA